jgi:hypothetical protein
MVGLLGRVINPSQGLYLHRTTQHRKTRDKHPCLERNSNPRTKRPSGQLCPRPRGLCDRQFSFFAKHYFFFPWLYSPWRTLAASHIGGFLSYLRHTAGLLGRVISPSQGLYLHRTPQQKDADKHTYFKRDSNPRSQQPTGQDPCFRPHGHCDRQ